MDASKGTARDRARAEPTGGKGSGTRSDAAKVTVSVFGSALTVAVALAALILTSAHHTREQLHDQIELTRRHFVGQISLMRAHSDSRFEQARAHFDSQIDQTKAHFDLQLGQVRDELREAHDGLREVRRDVREVRGDVRALAERQARVEGLLLAVHRPEAAAPPTAGGSNLPPSHPEYTGSE